VRRAVHSKSRGVAALAAVGSLLASETQAQVINDGTWARPALAGHSTGSPRTSATLWTEARGRELFYSLEQFSLRVVRTAS